MVGVVAYYPVVVLSALNEIPTIDASGFEIAAVGNCGRRCSKGGESQMAFGYGTATVGIDIDVVGCTGIKTGESVGRISYINRCMTSARSEIDSVVFHKPSSIDSIAPSNGGTVEQHGCCPQFRDTRAGADAGNCKVVEIGIAILVVGRHDGNAVTGSGVRVQRHFEFLPCGTQRGNHFGNLNKGGDVSRIGHHTHFEFVSVGGVASV